MKDINTSQVYFYPPTQVPQINTAKVRLSQLSGISQQVDSSVKTVT